MSLDSTALSRLRARLTDERKKSTDRMLVGNLTDLREYGYSCGYIKALDDTIIILNEILSDLQGS